MSSMDECWTAMALTLKYKHQIILLPTENLMWTRCTSSSEKKKKLEVFETRINHFKSCKTSLFLLFPLLLRLICEAERQSFGELQKSHPNTSSPTSDKSYLNCSHFSRSQQTTVSDVSEKEKGKKANCVVSCACFQMRFAKSIIND